MWLKLNMFTKTHDKTENPVMDTYIPWPHTQSMLFMKVMYKRHQLSWATILTCYVVLLVDSSMSENYWRGVTLAKYKITDLSSLSSAENKNLTIFGHLSIFWFSELLKKGTVMNMWACESVFDWYNQSVIRKMTQREQKVKEWKERKQWNFWMNN